MDAARSTSWSSLPPCAVPVAGACAASPCLTGSDSRSAPGLGSACAASASGRVSCHRRLAATACHRKVGSGSVRLTRSLRWGSRLSRKKRPERAPRHVSKAELPRGPARALRGICSAFVRSACLGCARACVRACVCRGHPNCTARLPNSAHGKRSVWRRRLGRAGSVGSRVPSGLAAAGVSWRTGVPSGLPPGLAGGRFKYRVCQR